MIDAALVKPPAFTVIIVHSFSRFFRDQFQFEFYVRKLAKNGVRLIYRLALNGEGEGGPALLTGICFCACCGGAMTLRTGKGGAAARAARSAQHPRWSDSGLLSCRTVCGGSRSLPDFKLRNEDGTYRRDHLRALAQRVEAAGPSEIRILGTKTELLRTLVAAAGVESAAGGVRSFIPKWRPGRDSNP